MISGSLTLAPRARHALLYEWILLGNVLREKFLGGADDDLEKASSIVSEPAVALPL
jgi:hypothetical protein